MAGSADRRGWIKGRQGAHALPAFLIAVDDSSERGPWMNVQAGARMRARIGASPSSTRA